MKTRAAVAVAAGEPLEVTEIELDGPKEGNINVDDLITHVMPLDEINDAFDLMHEGKSIRSAIVC